MTLRDWCFVIMYLTGFTMSFVSGVKHDWYLSIISVAFLFAVCGWNKSVNFTRKLIDTNDSMLKTNNELLDINEKLKSLDKEKDNLIQGLISEVNELKYKLKNSKMESARLRNKGGRRDE